MLEFVVFDFGELWIISALLSYGKPVRWANLLRESSSNVVMLPDVSQVEVETFILRIYCQNIATDNKIFQPIVILGFWERMKDK